MSALFLACTHTTIPERPEQNPDNYCYNKKGWEQWDNLIRKYPNDWDVQTLHALRIGLCTKIEQGSITFEDANDIFNRLHDLVIEKKKEESERERARGDV
jgi:hypothetical protein